MGKRIGVYGITVTGENVIYIGGSYDVDNRWDWHKYHLKRGEHSNKQLQDEYYANGDKFVFFIIEEIDNQEELGIAEQVWKDYYLHETDYYVFNDNDTVKVRRRMSDEEKKRRSRSQQGEKNYNYNGKLTDKKVNILKSLAVAGVDVRLLSFLFGISEQYVRNIKSGQKWKHIKGVVSKTELEEGIRELEIALTGIDGRLNFN